MLILTVKVGSQPTAPVDLAMACGSSCRGAVRFDPLLKNVPAGAARRVGVFLKCFEKAGADMRQIRTGLSLRTAGTLDLTVQRVALGTETDERIACYN